MAKRRRLMEADTYYYEQAKKIVKDFEKQGLKVTMAKAYEMAIRGQKVNSDWGFKI